MLSICLVAIFAGCGGRGDNSNDGESYEYLEEWEMIDHFVERVMGDTSTFYADLEDEADAIGVDIRISPDNRIKIYSWISGGGTSPSWGNVTQFRNDIGEVVCYRGLPIMGDDADYTVTDILMANNLKKSPVYFFVFYAKASSSEGYDALCAAEIQNGRIVPGPKFKHSANVTDRVGVSYIIPDWYFRTNGDGWEWMFNYDADTKQLYVPQTVDYGTLINRYSVYKFDGKNFVYNGEGGPWNIHSSLKEFFCLVSIKEVENHLLRIDSLKSGNLRLALWNNPSMSRQWHKPDLVLSNGRYNPKTGRREFAITNDIKYEVEGDYYDVTLFLTNKGGIVSSEATRNAEASFQRTIRSSVEEMNEVLPGFVEPKLLYIMENYIVRVDSMADGGYRYASWKRSEAIDRIAKPDLVLSGGVMRYNDLYDMCYIFKNGEYTYEVPLDDLNEFNVYAHKASIVKDRIKKSYYTDELLRIIAQ